MNQKQVKIVGFSINQKMGSVNATDLTFNQDNRLTIFKGPVGSGKTTVKKAMTLAVQGSNAMEDKNLYGNIDIVAQLTDGDKRIFTGCKTNKKGELTYFLYTLDEKGKKVKDVIIDGVKATPATYLKSLQTALTWRLDELTSENATTQRNILLELYSNELEIKGVIFDKHNPNYVGGIIDIIEKAKNIRSLMDMKRKEVGGIADDMTKKGIDFSTERILKPIKEVQKSINSINAKITLAKTNVEQNKTNKLNVLQKNGSEIATKLILENTKLVKSNEIYNGWINDWEKRTTGIENHIENIKTSFSYLNIPAKDYLDMIDRVTFLSKNEKPKGSIRKTLTINEKGQCLSKPEEFVHDTVIHKLLLDKQAIGVSYMQLKNTKSKEADTSSLEKQLEQETNKLSGLNIRNNEAKAINSYHNWQKANSKVNEAKKDYYLKLTGIRTGVKGLHIAPEYINDENGNRIAKDNNIYLMYDGSYDTDYFKNPNKELRKLSGYSGTQKPMICLLIQNYLLSKKNKVLPYLWIDNIPIDLKTRNLLDKMSEELGLWLFVNWTGDFNVNTLENGEILLENGEILTK